MSIFDNSNTDTAITNEILKPLGIHPWAASSAELVAVAFLQ